MAVAFGRIIGGGRGPGEAKTRPSLNSLNWDELGRIGKSWAELGRKRARREPEESQRRKARSAAIRPIRPIRPSDMSLAAHSSPASCWPPTPFGALLPQPQLKPPVCLLSLLFLSLSWLANSRLLSCHRFHRLPTAATAATVPFPAGLVNHRPTHSQALASTETCSDVALSSTRGPHGLV
jgi:hypothetical protein